MGEDYASRFETHLTDGEQSRRIAEVRGAFIYLVEEVLDPLLQEGREKSIVMTKLEEAGFFAVAAIAREDGF